MGARRREDGEEEWEEEDEEELCELAKWPLSGLTAKAEVQKQSFRRLKPQL